ncbi:MAG: 3-deoxy-D-manno-octulosonic acid transferase [Verrucomicrobiales bacterium]
MSRRSAIALYNLLLPLGLLLALPGQLLKMARRGNYLRHFGQRFGCYRPEVAERLEGGCDIWMHAVSVGEVFIARKLIEELRARGEGLRLVLSTTTSTGFAEASKLEGEDLTALYNPIDLPIAVARSLRRIAPKVLVLVEAEVWPNLVTQAKRAGIPVILVNARLSRRSEARFLRFSSFVRPVFAQLDAALVPYEEDTARWSSLGVAEEGIHVVGSMKYDLEAVAPSGSVEVFGRILDSLSGVGERSVLLLGSTHAGEEKYLGQIYLDLKRQFPDLFLVVVPRHFERSSEVVQDLRALGLDPVLRSTRTGNESPEGGRGDPCLIVDSTGELADWYRLADLVVIGKSFLGAGGQNPVEPVVAGVPVFFGPEMSNFGQLVEQLCAAGGAVQVADGEELGEKLAQYLADPAAGRALVGAAREVLKSHAGATAGTADLVMAVLKEGKRGVGSEH